MVKAGASIVTFKLEGGKPACRTGRYALNLDVVDRIISAVAVTPLPDALPIILGIINYQSIIIPVLNIRKRFHLASRDLKLSDHLIIARTSKRLVALLVDEVEGVFQIADQRPVTAEEISSSLKLVDGIIQMDDGLVIIHDLEEFLSLDEEKVLSESIEKFRLENDGTAFIK